MRHRLTTTFAASTALALIVAACSGDGGSRFKETDAGPDGSVTASGGRSGTGGARATGGSSTAGAPSGGGSSSGGAASTDGGIPDGSASPDGSVDGGDAGPDGSTRTSLLPRPLELPRPPGARLPLDLKPPL